ncbi:MAG: response regulator transcription factor [Saprospiraceae bacterium]
MKKIIFLYGCSLALLFLVLKYIDYHLFLRNLSVETYLGIIACIFTVVGIWMGLRLTSPKVIIQEKTKETVFKLNEENLKTVGISGREHDVLKLMAKGYSNQEIADQLFISLNTVKTHASKLFSKLDVKRRTQAVQRGKELGLI